ncbi:MAG: SH3 domain-containing protein [Propionicimonas sp.]
MSKARMAIAMVVTTAFLAGAAGITTAVVAGAATTLYTANAEVNVRSGPSTSDTVLDTLQKGEVVAASGNKAGDWQPITFNGTTAYVYAEYVTLTKSSSTPTTIGIAAKKTTSANVNLRTAASLTSEILKVLKKGTSVDATGRSSGDFTEVTVDGTVRWLYTKYVSGGTTTTPTPPTTVANVVTTSTLALRTSASEASTSLGDVKPNTEVGLTGKHSGSYTQAVVDTRTGWLLTGYLKAAASGPTVTLPVSVGLRYINATDVNVRKDADVESTKLATLARSTVLQATGPAKNKYTQIIFNGGLAWVSSEYLSTTMPPATLGSSSLDKLKATAKAAVLVVRDKFPQIKTIYGWRASSAYSSDHPNGRAIDIMIPSYKSNKALGDKIAQYFIDNNKSLKVKYVIWRQRNYTITRGKWLHMSDRGGDTANHYDHVHVSFLS